MRRSDTLVSRTPSATAVFALVAAAASLLYFGFNFAGGTNEVVWLTVLIGVLTLGAIVWSLDVQRWPLIVVLLYFLVGFALRPAVVIQRPNLVSSEMLITQATLVDGMRIALPLVLLACFFLLIGWHLPAKPTRPPRLLPSVRAPLAMVGFVTTSLGTMLMLQATGGLGAALSNIKTIRTEIEGQHSPMVLVWFGQMIALIALANGASPRLSKIIAAATIGVGTTAGIATGSRGSTLPILGAAVLIVALGTSRLRSRGSVSTERRAGRRLILLGVPLVLFMLLFGAFKQNQSPSGQGTVASALSGVSDVTGDQVANQFKDADYFAQIAVRRDLMPDSVELASRVAQFPIMLVPSAFGVEKPRPYDYDLRKVVLGGIVKTGLPASYVAELWLIGGTGLVAIGSLIVGVFLRRQGRWLAGRPSLQYLIAAVGCGWLYLFVSRPLVVSLSRGLILLVCLVAAIGVARLLDPVDKGEMSDGE
ncbi:hypothetical protein GHK92_19725 [Nocardioides sp. dk4132]|uniref:hypothetical protein n=1 Tax=unclassified Nocardioides TaxID=2615069 RepID=UPI0012955439|nr:MULTISPECIES: hypothetical protein [unclassified Nocardioides]MQW78102.1 hypothetical protein [Nocardioides sp. dk4132]QGA09072.1 hypothetical protein GFH29_17980 [Nocardioides sp. dk884]